MNNDRFRFRVPIKCRKCKKNSFRYGQLQRAFRIVEDGDECCLHCGSYQVEIIEKGKFEQCTTYKDCNKKVSFESDKIVCFTIGDPEIFGTDRMPYMEAVIEWRNGHFVAVDEFNEDFLDELDFEIIGNKWENTDEKI